MVMRWKGSAATSAADACALMNWAAAARRPDPQVRVRPAVRVCVHRLGEGLEVRRARLVGRGRVRELEKCAARAAVYSEW